MKKYSVLICVVTSVILLVTATLIYPGGSLPDRNSVGFGWTKNFLSNLFATKALNGAPNPGWIYAVIGMAFHSVGYGIFFIHMSKKIALRPWSDVIKFLGVANIVLIFLIATPLHDLGTLSIVLTLVGLFIITVFMLRSKLHLLKCCCIGCLLTYYCFFALFGFGYMDFAVVMQKVYVICSMLLILALEYFTSYEDFRQTRQ